ncbi:glycerophosphoryl diester phosphodiesterase membrane domain-containing protein [Paraoerskovia marina]|uniref:glycerophosphoryl diester phosphodiesterase membrane domain-containing protein n=1 Tax=Paraoerskovia marina TaxID=545619 RepID=UPI0004927322|nr:glycerophosphoryl diester phosphodiesterase membrane domain-containing protein [Paraoerskovia marina]
MTTPDQNPPPADGQTSSPESADPTPQPVPPAAPTPPGWGPAPQYGQYATPGQVPQYGQQPPRYGQPQGQYGPPVPGYTPPPAVARPGIIPLRPLRLGEIYDGAFGALRANPKVMLGVSSAIMALATIVAALVTWYLSGYVNGWVMELDAGFAEAGATATDDASALLLLVGQLTQAAVIWLVTPLVTGLLIVAVSQAVLGRKPSYEEVRESSRGRVWRLLVWTLALMAGTIVVAGTLVFVVVALAIAASEVSIALAVIVGIVGLVAYVGVLLWLSTRVLLVPAAIVLEGQTFGKAVARGWRLTRGHFWRLLGISLLTQIILGLVASLVVQPFSLIAAFVAPESLTLMVGASMFGSLIANILTVVIMAAVVSLLYIDVRMRTEGLDIELAAAATRTKGEG